MIALPTMTIAAIAIFVGGGAHALPLAFFAGLTSGVLMSGF